MTDSRLKEQSAKSQEDLGEGLQARNRSPTSISNDEELARRSIQEIRESNLLVPINRLPTELFIAVFQASLETCSNRFERLRDIALVAWKWYSIVKQSPGLWAVLDSRTPADQLPIFLQRARDSPLTINMHLNTENHLSLVFYSDPGPESAVFLDLVLPKLARWKEATLYLRSQRPGVSETLRRLEQPAPFLRKFHMDCKFLEWGSQVDLFQGHAPNLAELSIYNLPIRWSSSVFRDLLSISIASVTQSGPTVEEVFQWIVSCPRLRSFRLRGIAFSPSTHHQDVLPIELPHLSSLDLTRLLDFPAQLILSRIRAPALRNLFVASARPALVDGIHPQTFFNNSILHFRPTILSSIGHAQGLAVSMDVSTGNITVSTTQFLRIPDEGVTITFHHPPGISGLQLCLELLLRDFSLWHPIALSLSPLNNVPESDLLWILDSKLNNRVTRLTMSQSGDDSFLEFLCKERHRDGVATWPFPKLKILTLPEQAEVSMERLKRLLKQRYAPDPGTFEPQSPSLSVPPDRLTSLRILNIPFSRSDYKDVADIVGVGVLRVII